MLTVISPAKSLNWEPVACDMTSPDFQDDAVRLSKTAKNLSLTDLKGLMKISDDLARLNRDRFRAFEADPDQTLLRPAAFAFNGDTYQGLQTKTLNDDDLVWAQTHLRILSGLYGLLRPLDAMQPYRLEMGSRLKTRRGKSLYDYWGQQLSKGLNTLAEETGAEALVNCASQEYFGAVDRKALKLSVITPQFMEVKDARPRIVSFFAKRARGAMARFMTQNRITDAQDLRAFNLDGYAFDATLSSDENLVFTRPYPKAV
jgi:hypothetical protein